MFMDFVTAMVLLLWLNIGDVFQIDEFQVVKCLAELIRHCERLVHYLAFVLHTSVRLNKMWLNKKTLLKWYSGVHRSVREGSPCVFVFPKREYGQRYKMKALTIEMTDNISGRKPIRLLCVGVDESVGLREKGGNTTGIARSHCGCCNSHQGQTKRTDASYSRDSQTSCIVY